MQLTQEQISTLFAFTQKKYVHFYDLQCEIVDHLAAAIEERLEQNSEITFEEALSDVYKSFGIFGFAKIVREKEKQLDKQSMKMFFAEIKHLFTYPHLIFSSLLFLIIYTLSDVISPEYLYPGATVFSLLFLVALTIFWKRIPKPAKPLRMFSGNIPYLAFLPYGYAQILIQLHDADASAASRWVFVLFTFFSVLYLIANYRIFIKMRSKAQALYPEAFLAAAP